MEKVKKCGTPHKIERRKNNCKVKEKKEYGKS